VSLASASLLLHAVQAAASPACSASLKGLCEGANSCDVCAGKHQSALRAAGCSPDDVRSLCAAASGPLPLECPVHVSTSSPVGTVDAREVSLAWDIYALDHQKGAHTRAALGEPGLRSMVRQLRPLVLRISGTGAEGMQLGPPAPYIPTPPHIANLTLRDPGSRANVSLADWDQVLDFAAAVGADLVLGFNQLLRHWANEQGCAAVGAAGSHCPWNSSNARAWALHNRQRTDVSIAGYELGK
jgi:hypothetical protein